MDLRWYLEVKYFRKFSSDFNKQSLKWKLIPSPFILRKKNQFFSEFKNFHKKKLFIWHQLFFNSDFCQPICSISTNEVSNEILWYPLSILIKKLIKLVFPCMCLHEKSIYSIFRVMSNRQVLQTFIALHTPHTVQKGWIGLSQNRSSIIYYAKKNRVDHSQFH